MRVVLALGGLAALGLAAFMLTMGRPSGAGQASVAPIKPLHPVRKPGTHGTLRGTLVKTHAKPQAVAAKPKVTPAKPGKVEPKPVVLLPGLPAEVATALRTHELVVVALYDPQARVDQISLAEASAGAKAADAGFVPLNVLRQRQAGPLMRQLGVLPDPAVLVYRRPGDVVARFDGFADRDTVAQAVLNAMPPALAERTLTRARTTEAAVPTPVTLQAWDKRASAICSRVHARIQPISPEDTQAKFLRWAPTVLAAEQEIVVKLKALAAPTEAPDRVLAQRVIAAIERLHVADTRLVDFVRREGKARASRLLPADATATARANGAATAAGATGCAVWT
jgi:hypothetical protein